MIRKVHFFSAGCCAQRESLALAGGSWKTINFPSIVAAIEHSRVGVVLFDTGYAPRIKEATRRFPERLYEMATPVAVTAQETAAARLQTMGIRKDDVRMLVFSHFHADHWGGAADFGKATCVFARGGYERLRHLSRLRGVCAGFLPALLPPDLESRSRMLTEEELLAPGDLDRRTSDWFDFDVGHDLFGDQSMMLFALPGHAAGQLGALVREDSGKTYFLIGDACWLEASYRQNVPPPGALVRLLFDSAKEYMGTLRRIHEFSSAHPEVVIVPSHCARTLARLERSGTN